MARRPTAREMDRVAAGRPPQPRRPPAPAGDALAILARRGLRPSCARPDLPFPPDLAGAAADLLAERLGHYAFRLFLRGAIQRGNGFTPDEATSYVSGDRARTFAEALVALGLATTSGGNRYRLVRRAASFGGTLEWYVGRELRRWLGFDVATGVKFHPPGVGGDLDLMTNIGRAIAAGLRAAQPPLV